MKIFIYRIVFKAVDGFSYIQFTCAASIELAKIRATKKLLNDGRGYYCESDIKIASIEKFGAKINRRK